MEPKDIASWVRSERYDIDRELQDTLGTIRLGHDRPNGPSTEALVTYAYTYAFGRSLELLRQVSNLVSRLEEE